MNAKEFMENQKWKADLLIRESKAEDKGLVKGLMISGGGINQPGESGPYKPFDKTNPEHPDYEPPDTQEQYDQLTLPIELANMQEFKNGGRYAPDTGAFINNVGEAWIRMPDGRLKFDGLYNKKVHGPVFPMDQVKNNPQDDMKIKIAHAGPGQYYTEEGEVTDVSPYTFNRNTTQMEVPWLKEEYYQDLPRREKLHEDLKIRK